MKSIIELYNNSYTLEEIGKLHNISRFIVRKNLKKAGVKIRTSSETVSQQNQFILTPYINDVIIGELLGDGCIYKSGITSGGFVNSTSRRKYLEWLYLHIFKDAGVEIMKEGIKEEIINPRVGFTMKKPSICYRARTLSYLQFGVFRSKWYPNDTKVVPDNLIITPTVLLHWYLGDGSIHKAIGHNPKRGKTAYIYKYVHLHTNGFTYEQCQMLAGKLNMLGFDFGVKRHVTRGIVNYQLRLNKPAVNNKKFFEYMGNCPDFIKDVYGYKWDWQTEKIENRKAYYAEKELNNQQHINYINQ